MRLNGPPLLGIGYPKRRGKRRAAKNRKSAAGEC